NGIPSLPFVNTSGGGAFGSKSGIRVYEPFRFVYNPSTQLYTGFLTLQNLTFVPISGTFKLFFPSLPSGVTLGNPSGTASGRPFLQTHGTLPAHRGILRVTLQLRNPRRVPLGTFYHVFPVQIEFEQG